MPGKRSDTNTRISSTGGNTSHDLNFTKRMPNLPFNALLLPVVLCFAFLLVLLMNCKTTSYKPTCLLKLPTAFRIIP
jgi:hypothetical protein